MTACYYRNTCIITFVAINVRADFHTRRHKRNVGVRFCFARTAHSEEVYRHYRRIIPGRRGLLSFISLFPVQLIAPLRLRSERDIGAPYKGIGLIELMAYCKASSLQCVHHEEEHGRGRDVFCCIPLDLFQKHERRRRCAP